MIIKLPLAPAPLLLVRLAAARPFSVRRRCGFRWVWRRSSLYILTISEFYHSTGIV